MKKTEGRKSRDNCPFKLPDIRPDSGGGQYEDNPYLFLNSNYLFNVGVLL
jgi:hypothetical protein